MNEIAFDKYARKGAYHWVESAGPLHRINAYTLGRYELVLSALETGKLSKGTKVLDVGCGDGALAGLIASRLEANVDGIDVTTLPIELARKEFEKRRLIGRFSVIDGYQYPYPDGSFAAVVCSDVIEHVQKPEQLLTEMWRLLAPGGRLVVTTPIRYTEDPLDRMHVKEWFPEEFCTFCQAALGVQVELRQSHPVALAEVYASATAIFGRLSRLFINVVTKFGWNPFLRRGGFRAFSTQMIVAVKPF